MAQNQCRHTLSYAQAAQLLLDDFVRFGYTDVVGPTPVDFTCFTTGHVATKMPQEPVLNTDKPATQAATKVTEKTQPAHMAGAPEKPQEHEKDMPSPVRFEPAQAVQVNEGTLPFSVLVAQKSSLLWQEDEATLWQRMLAAIDVPADKTPTFIVLTGPAAQDKPMPEEHEQALSVYLQSHLADKNGSPVLVVGQQALRALSAGEATPHDVRNGKYNIEIKEQKEKKEKGGNIPLVTLYHPRTLLRQPMLKRQAWQDLLSLKDMLPMMTQQND